MFSEVGLRPKKGIVGGVIRDASGKVIDSFEHHVDGKVLNQIVNNASILAALAMKGDQHVTYMAVGTGNSSGSPVEEAVGQSGLVAEAGRVPVTIEQYDQAHAETDTVFVTIGSTVYTNKIRISGEFGPSIANNTTVYELGLFGGPGADQANGGIMVSRKAFAGWLKPDNSYAQWYWILVF
jgi:hypothetical protein